MANYKEIKGISIQHTDTDPVVYAGSWASGGNLPTAKNNAGVFGTQSATMNAGGYTPASPAITNTCQTYDGSSWTEVADLSSSRYGRRGCGTTAAGLVFGGIPPESTNTESWNGSAWL